MYFEIETQPVSEPVSLTEVKTSLRLLTSADDALITRLITAARIYAEKVTHRSLVVKGYIAYFEGFPGPGKKMLLPRPPLLAVSSITYLDSAQVQQTWDPAEYLVISKQLPGLVMEKPGNVYPVAACQGGSVAVHFTAGYSDEDTKDAIIRLAHHWYINPDAITGDQVNTIPQSLDAKLKSMMYHEL